MENNKDMEEMLAALIPDFDEGRSTEHAVDFDEEYEARGFNPLNNTEKEAEEPAKPVTAESYLGQKLEYDHGPRRHGDAEENKSLVEKKGLSKVGESIQTSATIREGWMDVDKALLGDRAMFYPENWGFRIRPAQVEAIRNWSTIDDENPNSVDDVFNEIIKSCLSIINTETGAPIPWGNLNSWDRFFFILLIRNYTMIKGETKIVQQEECPECDYPLDFELTSTSLLYDMPDPEVLKYYSAEDRCWYINPQEFDCPEETITLYLPTLEKDANIKAWMISVLQENRNKKFDQSFIRFLPWLAPKISKDTTVVKRQIREYELKFKGWDMETFSFMDEVLKNISVTPLTKMTTVCPNCGEEVTCDIKFPSGIRSLFNVANKHKKFGTK